MRLNVSETHFVDDLVHITDTAFRVLGTAGQPGSHYRGDKSRVRAAVATESRHYAIGKAMYGTRGH